MKWNTELKRVKVNFRPVTWNDEIRLNKCEIRRNKSAPRVNNFTYPWDCVNEKYRSSCHDY